jgi:hypothetical protein
MPAAGRFGLLIGGNLGIAAATTDGCGGFPFCASTGL